MLLVDNNVKNNLPPSLKKKLYHQWIVPVLTYVSEMWSITKFLEQKGMEIMMFGITLRDRKKASWIREHTKVEDILTTIKRKSVHEPEMSCDWDNGWTFSDNGNPGTVKQGWTERELDRDEKGNFIKVTWNRLVADRDKWSRLGEAFVLQWAYIAMKG